jgi:hypothetical protein
MFRITGCLAIFSVSVLATALHAQEPGRPQDGFSSGQTGAPSNGQVSGQVSGRVDGRGNRNEGVSPSAGDATKQNQATSGPSTPTNAEAMDAIVRPGVQR